MIEHKCDVCKNEAETLWVDRRNLHKEIQNDLPLVSHQELKPEMSQKQKDWYKKLDQRVMICENCRSMDARLKLGSDIFSDKIIEIVTFGIYNKCREEEQQKRSGEECEICKSKNDIVHMNQACVNQQWLEENGDYRGYPLDTIYLCKKCRKSENDFDAQC